MPSVRLSPPKYLKWLSERDAGPVGYCLAFEDRAAACPELVGGKAASLALLASVQSDEVNHTSTISYLILILYFIQFILR